MERFDPAIDSRLGFLPSRFRVAAWFPEAGWSAVAPIVPLTDLAGISITERRLTVRLAWTADALLLRAECRGESAALKPELAPEDDCFWTQDHIELRLRHADGGTLQVIAVPDGRCWDSRKERLTAGRLVCSGAVRPDGWELELRLACEALGLDSLCAGMRLRGLVAAVRWTDAATADLVACTAVELGFQQAERFAEWVFEAAASRSEAHLGPRCATGDVPLPLLQAVACPDARSARLTLRMPGGAGLAGHLAVRWERADGESGAHRQPLTLPPGGETVAETPWPREPRRFTRLHVAVEDAAGRHELAAPSLRAEFPPLPEPSGSLVHPYLWFDTAGLSEFRRKAQRPLFRDLSAQIAAVAESPPSGGVSPPHVSGMDLARQAGDWLGHWLVTADARWIGAAARAAAAAADTLVTEPTFHLPEGNVSPLLALGYDTFYPHLTDDQRTAWRRLLNRLLDLYLESARRHAWTVTAIPNANPVANAGAGYLALALWNEAPDKAREALGWVRRAIWSWLDYCFGRDGGNTEGCQYWQYGTESWLRFAALHERFFGRDDGLLDHPALRNGMNMIRVALCNDGALHGVNDTVPMPCGMELAWFWAGRYDDRFALWYGDHARRWYAAEAAAGRPTPYRVNPVWGVLFRPDLPEQIAQPESLPQAFALRSIEYGILRSGPEWNCRWTAGLKGSRPPYTHHNQADTGACFVDLRGERLLIDPGYYKPAPTDHGLPLIGGRGPSAPSGYTGAIVACGRQGDLRQLALDTTPAYGGAAARVVRHLVLVGEEGLVLLDDIVTDRPVTAQYQGGGVTESAGDGRRVIIAGDRARLRLELATRAGTRFDIKPERSLHDVHWGYRFARCRLVPVTADYAADADDPLVTVLLDVTDREPGLCRIERPHADCLVVRLPSGRAVRFIRIEAGWRLDMAGTTFGIWKGRISE